MPTPDSKTFADEWVAAWNAHDVDAVLAHFHDDVVFTSPVAERMLPDSAGVVRGREALRGYWITALKQQPKLHFELLGVYEGQSVIVINYSNHREQLVERGADLR